MKPQYRRLTGLPRCWRVIEFGNRNGYVATICVVARPWTNMTEEQLADWRDFFTKGEDHA